MKTNNLEKTVHPINLRKLTKPVALCITALFIMSMLSVFSSYTVQAATAPSASYIFGNTAVGTYSDQNDANAQSVSYFTSTTTGSVTDIIAYIDGTSSGKCIAALYAVSGGSAGALLEQSNAVNLGTAFSWVDFQLPSAYPVTSGTTYGLAIMSNVPVNLMEVIGTGQRDHNAVSSYANGFANPFGMIWGTSTNGAMSIYAVDPSSPTPTTTPTPTPTGTSTPTPKPTATPTPTPTPTPTSSTFGNTAIGTYSDQNDANAQSVSYFTSTTTGSVTDIIAYIDGTTTGKAIAALYATNGGSAGALLEQSSPINLGTTMSWVDFQLPSAYPVTSGTTYGLAIMSNVPVNLMIVIGTGQRDHNAVSSYANGFANPFGIIWGTSTNGAMSIYAESTTTPTTPTPTPSPTPPSSPTSTNLTPMPTAWETASTGMGLAVGGVANDVVDSSVTYNGQTSIRNDPHTSSDTNYARECDGPWIPVSPGDHVVFSCWMKTSASTLGDNGNPLYGARIGIDFYANGQITGTASPDGSVYNPITGVWPSGQTFVAWDTSTWTQVVMNFVVAASYPSTGGGGYPTVGQMVVPTGIIPWMQVTQVNDGGQAWFANTQLTITS
jgi:hypothetical protein